MPFAPQLPPWLRVEPRLGGHYCACAVCRVAGTLSDVQAVRFLREHAEHRSASPTHYGAGDVVAAMAKPVARVFGRASCTPCEARRRALNRAVPAVPFFRRAR